MTTRAELQELIRNGENSGVEFKQDVVEGRALAKELVALTNLEGGRVLLGVNDDGSVTGIDRADLEEWVMQVCRDKIRPEIIPFFEVVRDVSAGKDVAVVRVEPGYDVHHVWHTQHRTYYVRVGTISREASPEELSRLFQQRGGVRAELRPVSGTGIQDLDARRYADYFRRMSTPGHPTEPPGGGSSDEPWERLLTLTEFLAESGSASVAGLVLFGRRPERFLPQAQIDAAAYPGTEKDYATSERSTLRGALLALLDDKAGVLDAGLVEQAVAFVGRNVSAESRLVDGVRRQDHPAYPPEVLREVFVNALVHRDYLLSATTVELSVYEDRLEVTSPGRLPNGISVESMLSL